MNLRIFFPLTHLPLKLNVAINVKLVRVQKDERHSEGFTNFQKKKLNRFHCIQNVS